MKSKIMLYLSRVPFVCAMGGSCSFRTDCIVPLRKPRVMEGAQELQANSRQKLTDSKLLIGGQRVVFLVREMVFRVVLLVLG